MSNRLKIARVVNGDLTQEQLANEVGCSRQTINSIEKGRFVPSVELVLRITRRLGVRVEEVFFLEEEV
ncbi:MAG: transcriptional regulator [Deltaproteobacteria bacterium RIFOXYA12_FULL_61_11]|nr:MAG: transcriptional regulator [Deltaproteobacteria bacterium RIFOXYA12_FULL_61_11]